MSESTLELDASMFARRLRNRATRPERRVKPRGMTSYLRKHPIADVWSPDYLPVKLASRDEPRQEHKNATSVITKASSAYPTTTEPDDSQPAQKTTEPSAAIDFAQRASQWQLDHSSTRKHFDIRSLMSGQRLLITMSAVIFFLGIGAAVNTFLTNRKVVQTVSAAANESRQDQNGVNADETKPDDAEIGEYTVAPHMPRLVIIPKFGVRGIVRPVGIDKKGAMAAPTNIYTAGWFNESALPGADMGATVLDGHVSGPTSPGIFSKLKDLKPGDNIQIEKGDRSILTYKVVSSKKYKANNVNMNEVVSPAPGVKRGLNLITCTGSLDKTGRHYTERLVVFTTLES